MMTEEKGPFQAVFFISTGRTGTQWFAEKLSRHYQDLAVVNHEPFQEQYSPRYYFNVYHNQEEIVLPDALSEHLRSIQEIIRNKHYIETGWPVYGILPYFLLKLREQARVVHLYRHPLRVAASLTTHHFYSRGKWTEAVCLHPSDRGVRQAYLAGERWDATTEFERCLFWTTEINLYASRLKSDFPPVPWLELSFEKVFSAEGDRELQELLDFVSLPLRPEFLESKNDRQDRHVLRTDQVLDASSANKYPQALAVMDQLGYGIDQQLVSDLQDRYQDSAIGKLKKSLIKKGKALYLALKQLWRR